MNVNKEKMGALFILAFSIAYGIYAAKIPLIFLSQGEALNARTMPYALSIAGIVISLLIIILPSFDKDKVTTAREALSARMTTDRAKAITSQPNCARKPCASAPMDANDNIAHVIQT